MKQLPRFFSFRVPLFSGAVVKPLFSMAWRNLLRSKRRTIICTSAIALGLCSMMVFDSFSVGMNHNLVKGAVGSFLGEAQMHARGFKKTLDPTLTIKDPKARLEAFLNDPRVAAVTPRTYASAMISSTSGARPVVLVGIVPETEKQISRIDRVLIEGRFLGASPIKKQLGKLDGNFKGPAPHAGEVKTAGAREILVGKKLAQMLGLKVGTRTVVSASTQKGTLAQEMVRVVGIFSFATQEMDAAMAFISLDRAQALLGIEGSLGEDRPTRDGMGMGTGTAIAIGVGRDALRQPIQGAQIHEIALRFTDPTLAQNFGSDFWTRYSDETLVTQGWPTLVPQLQAMIELSDISIKWVAVLLMFLVGLGILNTLMMAFFERAYEFGVMKALGTRSARLAMLVMVESFLLAVLGIVVGVLFALALDGALSIYGVRIADAEVAGVSLNDPIFPVLRVAQFVTFPLMTLFFTLVAGIYPAYLAAKTLPASAMRRRQQ